MCDFHRAEKNRLRSPNLMLAMHAVFPAAGVNYRKKYLVADKKTNIALTAFLSHNKFSVVVSNASTVT